MQAPSFPDVLVVGMYHRGAQIKNMVANLIPPFTLTLEREPSNYYDSNAIKVFYGEEHIGYIEATQTPWIAPHLDEGVEFDCTATEMVAKRNNIHPLVTLTPIETSAGD